MSAREKLLPCPFCGGGRVEVWPHEWSPDEVMVTTGRENSVAWYARAAGDAWLREAVCHACEVAGVAVQTRMEV